MAKLVDTTIRLLSQEPLAGSLPTAEGCERLTKFTKELLTVD